VKAELPFVRLRCLSADIYYLEMKILYLGKTWLGNLNYISYIELIILPNV
jgi:hypothetical protein